MLQQANSRGRAMILADGHVHFHACYDVARFLDAAADNFAAHDSAADAGVPRRWMLWLTEAREADFFDRLREGVALGRNTAGGQWTFEATPEDGAIRCRDGGGRIITLAAGRQIVTGEGVEVLALGTTERIRDGMPIGETLSRVCEAGALSVLPWGFGKWLGRRGSIITRQLGRAEPGELFLGDNSGRPALAPPPRQFTQAQAAGIRILPGSDPLPFPEECRNVASYGFRLDAADLRPDLVGQAKELLRQPGARVTPFGRRNTAWDVARNQIALRLARRTRTAAAS